MSIDWFTFAAQVVNFLILIGLLWRFAYRPLLRAMDDREAAIHERLEQARQQKELSEQRAHELDEARQELDDQRDDLLAEARQAAEERRKELVAEAREHVQQSEAEWRNDLQRRQQQLVTDIEQRVGQHLVTATRRLLEDLADAQLEEQVLHAFTRRLDELDQQARQDLQEALAAADGDLRIASTFELEEPQRKQLRDRLGEVTDTTANPRFEQDSSLLCGVAIRAGEHELAWHAAAYVAALRERIETTVTSAISRSAGQSEDTPESDDDESNKTGEQNA